MLDILNLIKNYKIFVACCNAIFLIKRGHDKNSFEHVITSLFIAMVNANYNNDDQF